MDKRKALGHAAARTLEAFLNLVPKECLFIDDKQENIDAALAYGMKAIRFDGYATSYPIIMNYLSEEGPCA